MHKNKITDSEEMEIRKLETMSEKELEQEVFGENRRKEENADIIKLLILGILLLLLLIALLLAGRYLYSCWQAWQKGMPVVAETEKIKAGEQEETIPDTVEKSTKDQSTAVEKIEKIRSRRQKQEELYTAFHMEGGYTYLATGSNIDVESIAYERNADGELMMARVTGQVAGEVSVIEIIYEDEEPVFVGVESYSGEWKFYLEDGRVIRYVDASGVYTDYSIYEAVNPVYLERGAAVKFALDLYLGSAT